MIPNTHNAVSATGYQTSLGQIKTHACDWLPIVRIGDLGNQLTSGEIPYMDALPIKGSILVKTISRRCVILRVVKLDPAVDIQESIKALMILNISFERYD